MKKCNKCCGTGELFVFNHVKGGVCFSCNGTGVKHTQKRTKVTFTVFYVECKGESVKYPYMTESEANDLVSDVECMHLSPVEVVKHESFKYEFKRVAA